MSLFPILQPVVSDGAQGSALAPAREPAWDFENDIPIFSGGEPLKLTGLEAVKTWALNALLTERLRYPCLSTGYGSDVSALIGKAYSEELKQAEAVRYIKECLLESPYITAADIRDISFHEALLSFTVLIKTIYGEVKINV